MRHFVNRKTVVYSETLPSAAYLKDYVVHNIEKGDTILSDGTTTSVAYGESKTETYKNKTLSIFDNDLTNTKGLVDNPFLSDLETKGGVIPAASVTGSFYGILEDGVTLHVPIRVTIITAQGPLCEFNTSFPNQKMGFTSLTPLYKRSLGHELKASIMPVCPKTYTGFSTDPNFSIANTTGVSYIMIGFDTSVSKFAIYHGNGTQSAIDLFVKTKDTSSHTIEIVLKSTGIDCKLDAETITVTSRIPALTDSLYLHSYGIN